MALVGASLALLGACAESLTPFGRVPGGGRPPRIFWPPPPATTVRRTDLTASTFGDMATSISASLQRGGYEDLHWYPIGARYEHGFAVTTRLERLRAAGDLPADFDRWSELHPEPVTLRWLEGARTPRLPGIGHYRALLFAFTDLADEGARVPTERRETMMESTDAPPPLPTSRPVNADYRLVNLVFEYEADRDDANGAFVKGP